MARPRREPEPEQTFYHVELVDMKLGKIHFGPLSFSDLKAKTVEEFVGYLKDSIAEHGFFEAMKLVDLSQPLAVYFIGDDKTRYTVATIEP